MHLLDVVFPKRCVGCGKIGKYFCSSCCLSIRPINQNEAICPVCEKSAMDGATHPGCNTRYTIDGLTSFFHYRGVVQKAIKAIKYRFVSDLASEFVTLVPSQFFTHAAQIFIPIPLYPSREHFRGFNQAERLGTMLAQRLHLALRSDVLKRTVKTMSQVEVKDREKRLKNMEKAFEVSANVKGATIILFDDVWTTGATLRSAGNALKRAGASSIRGMTMAR